MKKISLVLAIAFGAVFFAWSQTNCVQAAGTFIWGHGSGYAQTSTWKIDPAHSSVNFEISHMTVSHVHGSLTNVNGIVELNDKDITKSSVEATIDTSTVSTGVVMRDNTLKSDNFFNVQKYPQITFRSSSLRRNKGTVQLLGNLTLNGVTRSVTLDLYGPSPPQTMSGKTISGFSATGLIRRSDFTFGASKFNTVIGDDVKFTIDVEIENSNRKSDQDSEFVSQHQLVNPVTLVDRRTQ
jgi:polyisoprenoid-binding protein YceI